MELPTSLTMAQGGTGWIAVLAKPFTLQALLHAVEQVSA